MPLGLVMLASQLKNHPEIKIIDSYSSAQTIPGTLNEISEFDPDFISISIPFTFIENSAVEIARNLKSENPDLPVIAGSIQASLNYKNLLSSGHFDGVVIGEGEETFREIAVLFSDGGWDNVIANQPDGLAVLDKKNIVLPERKLLTDLDLLAEPDYSLLPDIKYEALRIETSRGCGFNCPYCATSQYWGHCREFSLSRVVNVIAKWLSRGHKRFSIADDTFNLNSKRARQLCELITSEISGDIELGVSCRPELLSRDDLKIYRDADINSIFLGLESGSPEILKSIRRAHDLDVTRELISYAISLGIDIHTSFMIGLPNETRDDIGKTLTYAESLPTSNIGFHIFHPLPGTEFGDNMSKYEIEFENVNADGLGAIGSVAPVRTKHLSSLEISDLYDRAIAIVREKKENNR